MGSLGGGEVGREIVAGASDSLVIELNRLENLLREKERELGLAKSEIKALKMTESLKNKAITKITNELSRMDEKLAITEKQLENKNLEIKKLIKEKKEALAGQYSAEATLRRVYATQENEESVPVQALLAPLESDIRKYKNEILVLQEDNKALERMMKSKEAALVEADHHLQRTHERALIIETVQNQNSELKHQIEIFKEENKLLEKFNRQKVVDIEKLSQTIHELEESILAGSGAANAAHEFQRQLTSVNEEKKMLERELARVKVSVSRVAMAVANKWKDEANKVIPINQYLEERKLLHSEMERLQEKLALGERTAKAESKMRIKLSLRLKTLEEGLKHVPSFSKKLSGNYTKFGVASPRNTFNHSNSRSCMANSISILNEPISDSEGVDCTKDVKLVNSLTTTTQVQKLSCTPKVKFLDDSGKKSVETNEPNWHIDDLNSEKTEVIQEAISKGCRTSETRTESFLLDGFEDKVSGFLYDILQKEVILLRKSQESKNRLLNTKDAEIKLLQEKIGMLKRVMEVEMRKTRKDTVPREKDASTKFDDIKGSNKSSKALKRLAKQQELTEDIQPVNQSR